MDNGIDGRGADALEIAYTVGMLGLLGVYWSDEQQSRQYGRGLARVRGWPLDTIHHIATNIGGKGGELGQRYYSACYETNGLEDVKPMMYVHRAINDNAKVFKVTSAGY